MGRFVWNCFAVIGMIVCMIALVFIVSTCIWMAIYHWLPPPIRIEGSISSSLWVFSLGSKPEAISTIPTTEIHSARSLSRNTGPGLPRSGTATGTARAKYSLTNDSI